MDKLAPNLSVSVHQTERRVFRVLLTGVIIVFLCGLVIFSIGCLLYFQLLS